MAFRVFPKQQSRRTDDFIEPLEINENPCSAARGTTNVAMWEGCHIPPCKITSTAKTPADSSRKGTKNENQAFNPGAGGSSIHRAPDCGM
jgi:hypothetical protein